MGYRGARPRHALPFRRSATNLHAIHEQEKLLLVPPRQGRHQLIPAKREQQREGNRALQFLLARNLSADVAIPRQPTEEQSLQGIEGATTQDARPHVKRELERYH